MQPYEDSVWFHHVGIFRMTSGMPQRVQLTSDSFARIDILAVRYFCRQPLTTIRLYIYKATTIVFYLTLNT
jgi:hypothetical protein